MYQPHLNISSQYFSMFVSLACKGIDNPRQVLCVQCQDYIQVASIKVHVTSTAQSQVSNIHPSELDNPPFLKTAYTVWIVSPALSAVDKQRHVTKQ